MKPIKRRFFKVAVLLIVLGSMAIFYWFWSYKKIDEKAIHQNTDGVVMVDVKNIRNYFILSYLKDPTQWGTTASERRCDFADFGVETPDYLALFHLENQPVTQWFAVVTIEDNSVFEKAILDFRFIKTKLVQPFIEYYSKPLGICIIKHSNQILVSNVPESHKQTAAKVAEDLFLKKLFLEPEKTEKTMGTTNAVTLWIKKNSLLKDDGILNINLKDWGIVAEGLLQLESKYKKQSQFSQNPKALMSLGFNFGILQNQTILRKHSAKINNIIGFELDSILDKKPTKTELVLNGMVEKKDSAISYDYDDDFNPIKKVVVHTSREPSFYLAMQSGNATKIAAYLKKQNAIDRHNIFVNFPLAPTRTLIQKNLLTFEANPIKKGNLKPSTAKIGYVHINFGKLQSKDWNFIVAKSKRLEFLQSFASFEMNLTQANNAVLFQACLKAKDGKSWIEMRP